MTNKKIIYLTDDDLIKVDQIVIDHDKEGALTFIEEVIKKGIDREGKPKMK